MALKLNKTQNNTWMLVSKYVNWTPACVHVCGTSVFKETHKYNLNRMVSIFMRWLCFHAHLAITKTMQHYYIQHTDKHIVFWPAVNSRNFKWMLFLSSCEHRMSRLWLHSGSMRNAKCLNRTVQKKTKSILSCWSNAHKRKFRWNLWTFETFRTNALHFQCEWIR